MRHPGSLQACDLSAGEGETIPINSVQVYVQQLLNGLAMPQGLTLVAYITPPDPNVEAQNPTLYVWPADGDETRNPQRGGTVPRAAYKGAPSGTKSQEHHLDLYLIWMNANDDPTADTWFPGMVDAIMSTLRSSPDPVMVYDPYDGTPSELVDVGENMLYKIVVNALEDQAWNRYDALISVQVDEIFHA